RAQKPGGQRPRAANHITVIRAVEGMVRAARDNFDIGKVLSHALQDVKERQGERHHGSAHGLVRVRRPARADMLPLTLCPSRASLTTEQFWGNIRVGCWCPGLTLCSQIQADCPRPLPVSSAPRPQSVSWAEGVLS